MAIGWLCVAFAGSLLTTWAIHAMGLRPWRRSAGAHWTERARLLYPVRASSASAVWLVPANVAMGLGWLEVGTMPHWGWLVFAGWWGAVLGTRPFDRAVHPETAFGAWVREALAWSVLRISGWALVLGGALAMPAEPGWGMVGVALGYLGFLGLFSVGLMGVLRGVGLVERADAALVDLVRGEAERLGVAYRSVWVLGGTMVNAFAFPWTRDLVFSRRMLGVMGGDELAAVAAHELGHLRETRMQQVVRWLGSAGFFPVLFLKPATQAHGPVGLLVVMGVLYAWLQFARSWSRRLEAKADLVAHGGGGAGEDAKRAASYARALEKLHEANRMPAVFPARQQTHPHLYDRMLAAGVTPAYPRPEPAEAMSGPGRLLGGLFGAQLALRVLVAVRSGH